jgi:2-polyprenyl-3-methyl-5-hydroxy-6-metoxy-1,4-benzoquinol methylase
MNDYQSYLTKHLLNQINSDSRCNKKKWIFHNYKQYIPDNKSTNILDIGPGFGELLELFVVDEGYVKTSAIDISKEVVNYCNSIVPNSCFYVENTEEYLRSMPNKYDVILMLQVLEHIPRDSVINLLDAVRESLNPQGIAIIEVPNISNSIIGADLFYSDFTHQVAYTDTSLKYVLKSANFSSVDVYELKVPLVTLMRLIQSCLQTIISYLMIALKKLYYPSRKHYVSPVIYAVARK